MLKSTKNKIQSLIESDRASSGQNGGWFDPYQPKIRKSNTLGYKKNIMSRSVISEESDTSYCGTNYGNRFKKIVFSSELGNTAAIPKKEKKLLNISHDACLVKTMIVDDIYNNEFKSEESIIDDNRDLAAVKELLLS